MKKNDTVLENLQQKAAAAANEELIARKALEDSVRKAGYAAGALHGYKVGLAAERPEEKRDE